MSYVVEKVTEPAYFKRVLGNFVALGAGPKKGRTAFARFGETGIGQSPHYQIELEDGSTFCFNGRNHERETESTEGFEPSNLTDRTFDYSSIEAFLAKTLGR